MVELELKDNPPKELKEVLQDAFRLISKKTGVIKEIQEASIEEDDPLIFQYAIVITDTSRFSLVKCPERIGGAGLTREKAIAAAIGEAFERYCGSFYDYKSFIFSNYEDLKENAVHPEEFILFSDRQYKEQKGHHHYHKFTEKSKINWTWGYSLIEKKPKLVPACFVYLPYFFEEKEVHIGPTISTGASCGNSLEEAILYGIYECIERDAFAISWLNKLPLSGIDLLSSNNNKIKKIFRENFQVSNIEYSICDMTLDLEIPSFIALNIGDSNYGTLVGIGCATRLNPEEALQKVLIEVGQNRPFLRYLIKNSPVWKSKSDFSDIINFDLHGQLYTRQPELIPVLDFIRYPTSKKKIEEVKNKSSNNVYRDIQTCLDIFKKKNFDVIVVDITTRDIAEVGLKVVRVIIPKLQPIHGDHNFKYLGGKRLYQVPVELGYFEKEKTPEELNAYPHPFF
jgi:ribosomal protein S12 methylthiotransferase accessory factor